MPGTADGHLSTSSAWHFFKPYHLFAHFVATNRVRDHQEKLAAVEATQCTQVMFVMAGLFTIITGMLPHSLFSKKDTTNPVRWLPENLKTRVK
ncbi:multidrug resistance efflux transporter family protein [Pseudalkalibacillus caeni]|uniref:multidrug resistance efflux transporter family protein n=1 Tax=Exobacillus caeni TaxID=2574798 RepID=UPI003CCC47AD